MHLSADATHLRRSFVPGNRLADQIEIFFVELGLFLALGTASLAPPFALPLRVLAFFLIFILVDDETFADLSRPW